MTEISKLVRVAATTLVVGALAFASNAASAQSAQQACAADIQAHCAGVPQGEGRVAQCLRTHKQQLSPGCQRGMESASALMKEVVQACEDDVHRYCAGAARDRSAIVVETLKQRR